MAQVSADNPGDFPPPKPSVISSISVVPLHRQEGFLRQKYEAEGLSIRQISAQIFSARSTISKNLKDNKIYLRTVSESHALHNGQCAYGQKIVAGKVQPHKRELETLRLMQRLRIEGLSYWKIAGHLNEKRVPTKNKKGAWHATTVMKILKAKLVE